jgi:hypothetical protein
VITKFGIIRSRDEFLAALKRKDIDLAEYERLRSLMTKAESIGAQTSTRLAVKYSDHRLADMTINGTTANFGAMTGIDILEGRYFLDSEAQAGQQQTEAIKFKVKVQLKNPPPDIKPGLSVQADIMTGARTQVIAVPIQALVVRDAEKKPDEKPSPDAPKEQEGVYLMEDGKAKFQPIKTDLMGELSVEVTEGLKEGDTLITGPFRSLRTLKPGDKVREEKKKKGTGPDGPSASPQG